MLIQRASYIAINPLFTFNMRFKYPTMTNLSYEWSDESITIQNQLLLFHFFTPSLLMKLLFEYRCQTINIQLYVLIDKC